MVELPGFDLEAFHAALDRSRQDHGFGWYDLAGALWDQSSDMNVSLQDHPICGGALGRMKSRGATSCQYARPGIRWLGRTPEDFLTGPDRCPEKVGLPKVGSAARLRWDLFELHAAMNTQRRDAGLTWASLAEVVGCTPARLTNLKGAREADMDLVVRVTQWLRTPSATFIHAVTAEDMVKRASH